ncbi:MAG: glycerophosphodiester phosphodiesterase [Patescibacteria group bacterium]
MKIIGHRGARGLAPENTLASFQKALDHHVDMLEFDLRVSRDNVVVVHHNSYLSDPNGERHIIESHNYEQLLKHKKDLATFAQVLETIGHSVPLYVEVKAGEPVAPIVKIIKSYLAKDWKPEYLLLGSKSQKTLLELHAALPSIQTIVIEPWSGIRASRRARQLSTKFIAMNQLWLWSGFIRMVSRSGYRLMAYPLNDPVKARRWAKYGLYGVVTDYPDLFEK